MTTYATHSPKVIARIHKLRSFGYGSLSIVRHLRDEGIMVNRKTVESYIYNNVRSLG